MTISTATITATEYARVSRDKSGRLRSVEEQSYENRDAVDDQGWDWLPTRYAEDGEASASVFGTVTRTGFAALVEDLRTGRFPADVLVLWEVSRLSRQMSQWVALVNALETARVQVHVTSEERTYNLDRPSDRRDLQNAANEAEYYSRRLSKTLKRAQRANARAGRWSGVTPYGYKRVYSEDGEVSQVPDPATAPLVAEAYAHIAAGGGIAGLVKRWNTEGVPGPTGNAWSTQALRAVLLNAAYAGIRIHTPRSRHEPRSAKALRSRTTTEHEAAWEPIVSRELADKVRMILTDPSRLNHKTTGVAHLLSNIAECGRCGDRVRAARRTGGDRAFVLNCRRGHAQVTESDADEFVTEATVAYLQRVRIGPVSDKDTAAAVTASQKVKDAQDYLKEVKQAAKQGLSPLMVLEMQTAGQARLDAAKSELRRVSLPDTLSALLPDEPVTREYWDGMGLVWQRQVLQVLYGPGRVVGRLRIMPGAKGRQVPVEDRIKFGE